MRALAQYTRYSLFRPAQRLGDLCGEVVCLGEIVMRSVDVERGEAEVLRALLSRSAELGRCEPLMGPVKNGC